ncbi:GGDEF domain-containing protein [Deinococcus sp.]|uniref:GGDEF domain-containing protein n=1 Tax=Deinococcus sp. TaxID=47478 RepID=UPI003C7AEF77
MFAASRSPSHPAEQVTSSLEQGRKLILQLVCGGYLLYLLAHYALLPGTPFYPLGPELMTGYLCTLALLLSVLPTIHFRLLTFLLTLIFLPYAAFELLLSLRGQLPPEGYLAWTPLLLVLCFGVLGWRLGSVVTGLMLVALFSGLWLFQPATTEHLNAWLSEGLMLGVLTLICALITRFVENRLLIGEEASMQLAAARMDALTGLMGRAASELYLQEGLELVQQEKLPLSLVICDLDNFKAVNDRYGHPVGDAVLKAAARRLKRQTGGSGQVGRWGGEEFVVILPSVAKTEALVLAERMRKAIAGNDLAGLSVTASFGVAAYRAGDNIAELFERADQRLYEAKNGGRNTVRG